MSDDELVRQALAGRAEAYEELVRRWARRIRALCHARLGSADAADDLAQEAFLRGYRSLSSLTLPEKFGAWLCTIAVNACRNWCKARERSQVFFSDLPPKLDPDNIVNHRASEANHAEHEEELRRLRLEVAALPEECREVLLLYYQGDVTYRDLGELLGVSAATINARLTQARMLLRERLGVPRR